MTSKCWPLLWAILILNVVFMEHLSDATRVASFLTMVGIYLIWKRK